MRYSKEKDKSNALLLTIIVGFPVWGVGVFFILGFFTDPFFPVRLPVSIIVSAVISFYMYPTFYKKEWWDAFEKASPEERMRMEEERFQEEERMRKEMEERERKAAEEKRKREEEARKREEELKAKREAEEQAWHNAARSYFTEDEIAVLDESCWTLSSKKAKLEARKRNREKARCERERTRKEIVKDHLRKEGLL